MAQQFKIDRKVKEEKLIAEQKETGKKLFYLGDSNDFGPIVQVEEKSGKRYPSIALQSFLKMAYGWDFLVDEL